MLQHTMLIKQILRLLKPDLAGAGGMLIKQVYRCKSAETWHPTCSVHLRKRRTTGRGMM
jgi:hypothetical protein